MTDKRMYQLLEKFANEHTLAKDINATINEYNTSYTALNDSGAKFEDVVMLSDLVRGAQHFLFWVRRKKVKI